MRARLLVSIFLGGESLIVREIEAMGEHYTKNTLECTAYCNPCGALTQHRVDAGHRGPCLVCISKLDIKIEAERIRAGLDREQKEALDRENPRLF